jgi:nitrogen-specific signal transduction histidine kinase
MDSHSFAGKVLSRLDRLDAQQIEAFITGQLRERRLLEVVLDRLREGIVLADTSMRVVLLNAPARRLLDIEDARRGTGESLRRLFSPEGFIPLLKILDRFEEERRPIEAERIPVFLRRKRIYEISVSALDDDAGRQTHVLWLFRDAGSSERVREERERERYLEVLTTLTAGLAHEIRNPLNSLNIHATLVRDQLRQPVRKGAVEAERLQRSAEILLEEIARLKRIVDQFILAARPMKPDRRPTRLDDILHRVVELLTPECQHRHILLTAHTDPDLPMIPLDTEQLVQVLLNLAKNAIEAIEPDSTDGRVELRAQLESDHILIEVADNGIGIAEQDREKIFEPYYSTKESGSGLGLMVVWRIVKAHGGAIAVDSRPGEGTTFSIALPLDARPVRLLPGRAVERPDAEPN